MTQDSFCPAHAQVRLAGRYIWKVKICIFLETNLAKSLVMRLVLLQVFKVTSRSLFCWFVRIYRHQENSRFCVPSLPIFSSRFTLFYNLFAIWHGSIAGSIELQVEHATAVVSYFFKELLCPSFFGWSSDTRGIIMSWEFWLPDHSAWLAKICCANAGLLAVFLQILKTV